MKKITADQLVNTLREIVGERPDYVYERPNNPADPSRLSHSPCVYVDNSNPENLAPSCGIGHLVHRLGADLAVVSKTLEGNGAQAVVPELFDVVNGEEYQAYNVLRGLGIFQEHQDNGDTWRESLDTAHDFFTGGRLFETDCECDDPEDYEEDDE